MITKIINRLYNAENLTSDESEQLFNEVFAGNISPVVLSSVLTALKVKGETADEISGAALSMREFSLKPEIDFTGHIDTCGTGGDSSHSFNISSAVALILSSMGYGVAKHGNRSMTSKSGSADFYEELKIPVNLSPEEGTKYFNNHGFIFMFAPNYHPAMKYAVPVRKELKTRTIFNYLGPLTNPAGTKHQAIGVFHPDFLPLYASVAMELDYERIILYSGVSGMDEVSPYEETIVFDIDKGNLSKYIIHPDEYITKDEAENLPTGNDAKENADLFEAEMGSKDITPLKKLLALNSALSLKAAGHSEDFDTNYKDAMDNMISGTVLKKINDLREE